MQRDTVRFIDLPSDILLQVFGECDVFDVLSLSSTCKLFQQTADEHQIWLGQAKQLQIPIPDGANPSKEELRDWVVSRVKVDVCWIKGYPEYLKMHEFESTMPLASLYCLPGGKSVLLLYRSGSMDLKEIRGSDADGWDLVCVASYEQQDPSLGYAEICSGRLTETSDGSHVLAYIGEGRDKLFLFLVDQISRTIEETQVVEIPYGFFDTWEILTTKNKVFCCLEVPFEGWGLNVVQLDGPNTIQKNFLLTAQTSLDIGAMSHAVRFFSVSENSIVLSHPEGIYLYHIPELGPAVDVDFNLSPVWYWSGESSQSYYGSLYDTLSQYPKLYIQGPSSTHKLEFDLGESGFPVVLNHSITGELPAYCVPDEGRGLVVRGRKGVRPSWSGDDPVIQFNTLLLGKEQATGVFRVHTDEEDSTVRGARMDLDEVTGRLLVCVELVERVTGLRVYKLWLVDPLAQG